MRYEEPPAIDRDVALRALDSGERSEICDALVRLAFHDRDWEYVEARCLTALRSEDAYVRGVAATCLGHLARLHGRLNAQAVLDALAEVTTVPPGRAADAMDDIRTYIGEQ